MTPLLRLEDLIGRPVVDERGALLGRIEEIVVENEDDGCYVKEFHVGPAAFLQRLALSSRRILGFAGRYRPTALPIKDLDLSDPRRPKYLALKG